MKASLDDLAIFGGPSTFAESLCVGRPNIGRREDFLARVKDMLDRRWLTNDGPYVREFQQVLERNLGVAHCVAVANATVGLGLVARALGLTGEVILPAFTFAATAHALQWHGIEPVFADSDPQTHNLDPAHAERLITSRTTGILGVHVWGRPCAVEELTALARRRNLTLLFDAGHAFACSHKGRMIGNFGRAEVFSFHATKFVHSFEGGAIATNDPALAALLKRTRNFGFGGYDEVTDLGINAKMSEAAAAMGLTMQESLHEIVKVNKEHYEIYRSRLGQVPGLQVIDFAPHESANYQYVVVEIDEAAAGLSRNALHKTLWAEGVLARRYFYPGCHRMEPYRSLPRYRGIRLPVTEQLADRVLCLPTGTAVTTADVEMVCWLIEFCRAHGRELSMRIRAIEPVPVPAVDP
jgi:dTDP-4-amino-4,6-dideoxygalactose transaminase